MELHRPSGRWRLGLVLSLLCVFLWGVLPIALKILVQVMDPYTITWYRFLVAGSLLGSYLAARRKLPRLRGNRSVVFVLLILATLGLGGNYVLYISGLAYISPGAAQVLIQFAPALAMLGFLVFFRERFSIAQWLGLIVLAAGMLLFFHNRLDEIFFDFGADTKGACLIVLAAVSWAIYALAQKQLLHGMTSPAVLVVVYVGSMLFLIPAAAPQAFLKLDTLSFWLLVFCSLNTLVAYGSFSEALAHWEASRVSAVLSLTPLATLFMARAASLLWPDVVVSEDISFLSAVGAFLVVVGSMIIALWQRQPK
jgi:drug/metabolite transporter (DMT)-like permease